jgi:hypothetical protein
LLEADATARGGVGLLNRVRQAAGVIRVAAEVGHHEHGQQRAFFEPLGTPAPPASARAWALGGRTGGAAELTNRRGGIENFIVA